MSPKVSSSIQDLFFHHHTGQGASAELTSSICWLFFPLKWHLKEAQSGVRMELDPQESHGWVMGAPVVFSSSKLCSDVRWETLRTIT